MALFTHVQVRILREIRMPVLARKKLHSFRRWTRGGIGKLRRFYQSHFDKEYLSRMHAMREGDCHRCGYCCRIFFKCPHLSGENHCTIYDKRYLQCRDFPMHPDDLKELKGICGFTFKPDAVERVKREFGRSPTQN